MEENKSSAPGQIKPTDYLEQKYCDFIISKGISIDKTGLNNKITREEISELIIKAAGTKLSL